MNRAATSLTRAGARGARVNYKPFAPLGRQRSDKPSTIFAENRPPAFGTVRHSRSIRSAKLRKSRECIPAYFLRPRGAARRPHRCTYFGFSKRFGGRQCGRSNLPPARVGYRTIKSQQRLIFDILERAKLFRATERAHQGWLPPPRFVSKLPSRWPCQTPTPSPQLNAPCCRLLEHRGKHAHLPTRSPPRFIFVINRSPS